MDMREKIRMLGMIILVFGLICIPFGLAFAHEHTLIQTFKQLSPAIGVGAYCALFGSMLTAISFLLPKS